ncbi:hypothetical protein [Nocardioides hwasunensis]|uniref:Peptidase C39-like domain-containing protein n=1 Tax=Nocardioides hwasunensis TaxID=397258 RepID=A0ABR8MMC6_9ACTN|nr:hypothetical protein [Nocardioides hwasunensis]MBD3916720.1 hypothetical protein [Nocardioides hwasunensis]
MGLLEDTIDRMRDALAGRPGPGRAHDRLGPAPLVGPRGTTTGHFVQPDQTTCGSSCLVMARMLGDPAYATWIHTGRDGSPRPEARTAQQRFADEALATHVRTNRLSDAAGALQIPWPRSLGTTPWALATELRNTGGTAPPGTPHQVRAVAPSRRAEAYDEVVDAVARGHAIATFVGNRLRPGHVVLATASSGDGTSVYDPASGRTRAVRRDDFASGSLGISGWDEPWFVVLPTEVG